MNRERAAFLVMVDLDPVAGWGNDPEDWRRMLEHYLLNAVGHYSPVVIEFRPNDLEPMKHAEREAGAAEVRARVERLADEWDATVYELPPGYPMTVNEFCRFWFKAPLRAALNGGES